MVTTSKISENTRISVRDSAALLDRENPGWEWAFEPSELKSVSDPNICVLCKLYGGYFAGFEAISAWNEGDRAGRSNPMSEITPTPMPADYDPYHDRKIYHMADKADGRGGVSALCFKKPRAINLKRELWTLQKDAVTCKKCLAALTKAGASE